MTPIKPQLTTRCSLRGCGCALGSLGRKRKDLLLPERNDFSFYESLKSFTELIRPRRCKRGGETWFPPKPGDPKIPTCKTTYTGPSPSGFGILHNLKGPRAHEEIYIDSAVLREHIIRSDFRGGRTREEGVPNLELVFVIMMEKPRLWPNRGNPNAPFVNSYMNSANVGKNYFAVGHPSSTNYLQIVGGSNFGIRSDNAPDWHKMACTPNLLTNPPTMNFDNPNRGLLLGTGMAKISGVTRRKMSR